MVPTRVSFHFPSSTVVVVVAGVLVAESGTLLGNGSSAKNNNFVKI